jgi:hypothetical protein
MERFSGQKLPRSFSMNSRRHRLREAKEASKRPTLRLCSLSKPKSQRKKNLSQPQLVLLLQKHQLHVVYPECEVAQTLLLWLLNRSKEQILNSRRNDSELRSGLLQDSICPRSALTTSIDADSAATRWFFAMASMCLSTPKRMILPLKRESSRLQGTHFKKLPLSPQISTMWRLSFT